MKTTILKVMLLLLIFGGAIACSDDDETKADNALALAISPEDLAFDANGGPAIINVHVPDNGSWLLASSADWLTISQPAGSGTTFNISIAVAVNDTETARTASITLTSGGETRNLEIQQTGKAPEPEFVYDIAPDPSTMGDFTSVQLTAQMGTGWNLGNTLEAIGGETAWGNPMATKQLVDAVKAAGFTTIRIPVSWSSFSNASDFTINETWLNRVEEVVNYALDNNMYVIMNEHWDGGWMQPTNAQKDYVNNRLGVMWKQIATHFRDYDYHLIFAGSNEVMVTDDYNTPTAEYYNAQNSFNQTFVTTVRATGGRNAYRYLAVQGFNTNIDHAVAFAQIPTDVTANRILMEVHYYDPYNFTLNENSTITQWGSIATDPNATETWANESYVDAQFQKMKTKFIDNGVGVLLGEYGAIVREEVAGSETFRLHYLNYVSNSARTHGLVPVYWDNGFIGNHTMALFNRNTGELVYPDVVDAIMP
jgi:endoglucanase